MTYTLEDLLHLMARLRDPQYGCPWDLKQNYASIVPHTIEEAYEVADTIERGDFEHLQGELGDLLFQVVYYSQLAREEGRFEFDGVVDSITRKLIRRHPHVFPTGELYAPLDTPSLNEAQVKSRWEEIKAEERAEKSTPEQLSLLDDVPAALPQLPESIAPGTPAELLRRRPDVAAAEARLHAATARVGVATAELFPRLSLGGLLGSSALGAGALFEAGSASRSVFLGVDWSFLDVGRVRARIAASEAGAQVALAQYQQSVLLALEDTENALVLLTRTRTEDAHLAQAAEQRARAEQLAQRRYRLGSVGLYEVLDAQRDLYAAQDAAADSRARGLRAAVALYQALAGGWEGQPPAKPMMALQ